MKAERAITVLGGGPAGLAVGYYARRLGVPFTLYEQAERVGGNCATLRRGDFRLDTGAHRLHARDPEVTAEIAALLGEDLRLIDVPSLIYHRGELIDFPLSPLNLLRALGPRTFGRAALQIAGSRLRPSAPPRSFEEHALRVYGEEIAGRFLLNYSAKLWGRPCSELAVSIAGSRLKGLDVWTFVIEGLLGNRRKTTHLESTRFLYPRGGYGRIAEALAATCGEQHLRCGHRVTRLRHDGRRITAVELERTGGGRELVEPEAVASALPLDQLIGMLDPAPPSSVRELAARLRFRNVILVALMLDRPSVCQAATVYFPGAEIPFTRVYEPRNRCAEMSPPGKTSLVGEFPCQADEELWRAGDASLIEAFTARMIDVGWITRDEVLDTLVYRIAHAYPVLTVGSADRASRLLGYLSGFDNLEVTGRNGLFRYSWLHDQLRLGRELVQRHMGAALEA